jgi:hypothetical protein
VDDSNLARTVDHGTLREILAGYRRADVPLLVRGATGIGKSQLVAEDARRHASATDREFVAWNEADRDRKRTAVDDPGRFHVFVDLRLAQVDPTDLRASRISTATRRRGSPRCGSPRWPTTRPRGRSFSTR